MASSIGDLASSYSSTHSTKTGSSIYESLGINTSSSVAAAASEAKKQTLTQEDFLKLLTTQLQAQDPTNPTDNTELVSQMSQLSMVENLNSINSNMQSVIDTVTSSSALNATSLIGGYVYTNSNKGYYTGNNNVGWAINAGDNTYQNVEVTVKDAVSGEIVYKDNLASVTGEIQFAWNGVYSPNGLEKDYPNASDNAKVAAESTQGLAHNDAGEGSTATDPDAGTTDGSTGTEGSDSTGNDTTAKDDSNKSPDYKYCTAGRYVVEVTGTKVGETTKTSISTKGLGLVTSVTLGKNMRDTKLTLLGLGEISFEEAKKVTL